MENVAGAVSRASVLSSILIPWMPKSISTMKEYDEKERTQHNDNYLWFSHSFQDISWWLRYVYTPQAEEEDEEVGKKSHAFLK